MDGLRLRVLQSTADLRALAADWDDLWQRSAVGSPLFRAAMVAHWLDHFAPRSPRRILLVEDGDRLRAALPLVRRRQHRLIPVADLTLNTWSPNGELLLDPACDVATVLDRLVEGLLDLPWPLVWLPMVPYQRDAWQQLIAAARRRGFAVREQPRYEIGRVAIDGDFAAYQASWSKNHRHQVLKAERRLEAAGATRFGFHRQPQCEDWEALVRSAFQLESRGWKGVSGTAVNAAGMLDFFLAQARQLATWDALRLTFLEHDGRPIAFEYGWMGKGVYYAYKLGYDPAYAEFRPGQVLRLNLMRTLFEEPGVTGVDFHGPLNRATASWATSRYAIGRLILAPPRIGSRLLVAAVNAGSKLRKLAKRKPQAMDH